MEFARVVKTFDHPIASVWAVVSGFGAFKAWVAGVESCMLEGWGVGAIRSVTIAGRTTREQLVSIDPDAHCLSYVLLEPHILPARNVQGTMALTSLGASGTEFAWYTEATEIDGSPEALSGFIGGFYRASLDRLAQLLAHGPDGFDLSALNGPKA